jgi:hypothetical protein
MNRTKRLDYPRRIGSVPARVRNAAEAVMCLAHVARERHRLEQERVSLEHRMRRITARLTAIAGEETRLVPLIQCPARVPPVPPVARVDAPIRDPLPSGLGEMTLQY